MEFSIYGRDGDTMVEGGNTFQVYGNTPGDKLRVFHLLRPSLVN